MPIKSTFGFASGNKLLQKKWEERKYKAHQQKVCDWFGWCVSSLHNPVGVRIELVLSQTFKFSTCTLRIIYFGCRFKPCVTKALSTHLHPSSIHTWCCAWNKFKRKRNDKPTLITRISCYCIRWLILCARKDGLTIGMIMRLEGTDSKLYTDGVIVHLLPNRLLCLLTTSFNVIFHM